ncbi:hypothetical protein DCAR_0416814 [Daucus carota subsp. sativus]|uniref:Legume lectin domain-containing protein n=1 Tax=Daucus carota subsp. sativus TaxID=79200 RepID=A0A165XTI4_DAUCS|nr:PREDICTED: uncharacterized protein LOC108217687 [Daucus carota subsp. sativus]WOG97474.1 hypothetical protein DCAR_0416814 [Daucus carota subsp. sativus]
MATQHHHHQLLFLTTLFTFLTLSAARPCKTIIFISTSTSFTQNPTLLTLYFTNTPQTDPTNTFSANNQFTVLSNQFSQNVKVLEPPQLVENFNSNSIRDRTLDILSIVGALLFGVGSGVLTAAIMYSVWSVLFEGRFDFGGDEDDDQEINNCLKKLGYVVVDNGDIGAKQVD